LGELARHVVAVRPLYAKLTILSDILFLYRIRLKRIRQLIN